MRKFFLLIIVIFSFSVIHAQFNFGIKGGINANEFVPGKVDFTSSEMTYNPVGGLFFRIKSDRFFIMPEVLYSQKNGGFNYSIDSIDASYKVSYIDVPLMFGVHFLIFDFHTGPVLSFLLDESVNITKGNSGISIELEDQIFNDMSFGWQAGMSIEVGQFILGGRYEFNASGLMNEFTVPNSNITLKPDGRNSLYQFTLGIKFLKRLD